MAEIDLNTPDGLRHGLTVAGMSLARFSLVVGVTENTVAKWLSGKREIHPTAAAMLRWIIAGYRPVDWHTTGTEMREMRENLMLTQDELGQILDVDTETVALWESDDRGPPAFVARAMEWLHDTPPPVIIPKGDEAA